MGEEAGGRSQQSRYTACDHARTVQLDLSSTTLSNSPEAFCFCQYALEQTRTLQSFVFGCRLLAWLIELCLIAPRLFVFVSTRWNKHEPYRASCSVADCWS